MAQLYYFFLRERCQSPSQPQELLSIQGASSAPVPAASRDVAIPPPLGEHSGSSWHRDHHYSAGARAHSSASASFLVSEVHNRSDNAEDSHLTLDLAGFESASSVDGETEEEEETVHGCAELKVVFRLMKDPHVLCTAGAMVLCNATIGMLEPLLPDWMENRVGIDRTDSGWLWLAQTGAYLIATPLVGYLVDKKPKWRVLFVGTLMLTIGVPLVSLSTPLCGYPVFFDTDPHPNNIGYGTTSGLEVLRYVLLFGTLIFCGFGMSFVDTGALPTLGDIVDWKGYKVRCTHDDAMHNRCYWYALLLS